MAVSFLLVSFFLIAVSKGLVDHRISVVNVLTESQYLSFQTSAGKLQQATSPDGQKWSPWALINTTVSYPTLTSNPVSDIDGHSRAVVVFVQAYDGQAYMFTRQSDASFALKKLTSDIPMDLSTTQFSLDSVKFVRTQETNKTHLFVRSQAQKSRLYYGYQDWSSGEWSEFKPIGDSDLYLYFDFDVVVNTFVSRVEVYIVAQDYHMRHIWQNSPTSFVDSWHEMVLFPPKFNAAPAAHTMGHSDFNGVIEVFGREDNTLHHIHQTTCDKVNNPWGPCTWELEFHQLGDELVSDPKSLNPLSVTNNIHLGLEVFVVGEKDGHLYHIWQPERGKSWSKWEDLGGFSSTDNFGSQPSIVLDVNGWWDAFGLSSSTGFVNKLVQTPLSLEVTPSSIKYGQNATVTWKVPKDEATHKDWIGVYPSGANNMKYVDFMYVGGTQNPLADPVPEGKVELGAFLPDGQYDYRYLVNKEFVSVQEANAEVTGAVNEAEWVLLYQGIARGLGNLDTNITACVKDGNSTIDAFKESFKAFEDRQIIKGLQLFGDALKDIQETLEQCEETDIAEKLAKFIAALIQCTESNCESFVIDIGLEILVLYERIYEIYGDIMAAKNCFDIEAYEMGGICIGRVTWSCLTLPDLTAKYYN